MIGRYECVLEKVCMLQAYMIHDNLHNVTTEFNVFHSYKRKESHAFEGSVVNWLEVQGIV